jgi:hypothetical protein
LFGDADDMGLVSILIFSAGPPERGEQRAHYAAAAAVLVVVRTR